MIVRQHSRWNIKQWHFRPSVNWKDVGYIIISIVLSSLLFLSVFYFLMVQFSRL
ncbi:MAG TPA: hypothetical protein VFQ58_02350 [Flavisolibacter sp.]|nr:hypothetical protein [Flavisolibacter sp.]